MRLILLLNVVSSPDYSKRTARESVIASNRTECGQITARQDNRLALRQAYVSTAMCVKGCGSSDQPFLPDHGLQIGVAPLRDTSCRTHERWSYFSRIRPVHSSLACLDCGCCGLPTLRLGLPTGHFAQDNMPVQPARLLGHARSLLHRIQGDISD